MDVSHSVPEAAPPSSSSSDDEIDDKRPTKRIRNDIAVIVGSQLAYDTYDGWDDDYPDPDWWYGDEPYW